MALPTFPTATADFIAGLTDEDFANGGHRTNFIPAVQGGGELAAYVKDAAEEVDALATQVAEDAASAAAGSGTEASVADIRGGTDNAEYLSIRRVLDANEAVSLTRASTTNWDMDTGINFSLTLDGNVTTMANPTNQIAGKAGLLRILQDGTGGRTIGTWDSDFIWLNGEAIMPSAANAVLMVAYAVWEDGTIYLSNGGTAS